MCAVYGDLTLPRRPHYRAGTLRPCASAPTRPPGAPPPAYGGYSVTRATPTRPAWSLTGAMTAGGLAKLLIPAVGYPA